MARRSNYDKFPVIAAGAASECDRGWREIVERLRGAVAGPTRCVLCLECYPGVLELEIEHALSEGLRPATRRHWFTASTPHDTRGGVNVLNLVEGDEATIESPAGAFDPFTVHYAETFIVPAAVGPYTIRPSGPAEGKRCATIKAYVRTNP